MTVSDSSNYETEVAEALEWYLAALESSQPISKEDFLSQHPQHRDELERCLDSLNFINFASQEYRGSAEPERKQLGDYVLQEEIGRGGMGVVYAAEQISLNRRVALKVLPFAAVLDPRRLVRFQTEARAAAQLHHPNIVPVYSVGCEQGVHYYAMELVAGHTLTTLVENTRQLRRSKPTTADSETLAAFSTDGSVSGVNYYRGLARLGKQAADAFSYAHSQGVIHRDIKPSNLLIDNRGTLRVADFGLAQIAEDEGLSMTGDVLGTLRYMSPEQADGRKLLDERTDIYSLGVTLSELITLSPAFEGSNRQSLLRKVTQEPLTRPSQIDSTVPRDLETIVLKSTEKDAELRYDSMQDLADDLQRFLDHRPIKARRVSAIGHLRSWAKRNRLVASLLTIAGALLFGIAVLATLAASQQARLVAEVSDTRDEVIALQAKTKEQLYASDMLLAQGRLGSADIEGTKQMLLRHVPAEDEQDIRGFEWFYLWRQCHDRRFVREYVHEISEAQASHSQSRRTILMGVKLDTETGTIASRHERWLSFWDLKTGQLRKRHAINTWFGDLAFFENQLLAVTFDGRMLRYDLTNGKLIRDETIHNKQIHQVVKLAGDRLGTADWAGGVKVWNRGFQQAPKMPCELYGFVSLSTSGNRIATGKEETTRFDLFDSAGQKVWTSVEHPGRVRFVKFSPDGSRLCSINDGDLLPRVWDAETGELLFRLGGDADPKVAQNLGAFSFSPGGTVLVTAHTDGRIRFWDIESGEVVDEIKGHGRSCVAVDYSANGDLLVSASSDGTVKLWNLANQRDVAEIPCPPGWGPGIAFSRDGGELAAGGTRVDKFTWPTLLPAAELLTVGEESGDFTTKGGRWVHYAKDGKLYSAAAKKDADLVGNSVQVTWNDGQADLATNGQTVRSMAFSPDAASLLTAAHEGVTLWNLNTESAIWKLSLSGMSSEFHPSGDQVALAGVGYCKVCNAHDGKEVVAMKGRIAGFGCVRFSPDGTKLAGGAWDGTIQIWDVTTGERVCDIFGHADYVNSLAFSPDGRRLASGGSGGKVRLWNTATGELMAEFNGSLSITGNPGQGIAFSPDGLALLSATSDGRIKVWRTASEDDVNRTIRSALYTE